MTKILLLIVLAILLFLPIALFISLLPPQLVAVAVFAFILIFGGAWLTATAFEWS